MRDKWSRRGQELKETGCRETDGDKEMQNERGNASGGANTKAERLEGCRTDRQRQNREEEQKGRRGNVCEVAVPHNCWASDSMHRPKQ